MSQHEATSPPAVEPAADHGAERAGLYVARILQQRLANRADGRCWTVTGTAAFVDISGFTKLSEQLAKKGKEGAEQITEVIGNSFEAILAVAYGRGGSLLKFGGDALLLWFEGEHHVERAAHATLQMRAVLDDVGRIDLPDAKVTLKMSQGVHAGEFHFFAVGESHTELLPSGPGWSRLVEMEHTAEAGEILLSPEAAALLPAECIGDAKGAGRFLGRAPADPGPSPLVARPKLPAETLAGCLSKAVRGHVMAGGGTPEHRTVTVAFLRFEGVDELIRGQGERAAADALHRLVSIVQQATEAQDVAFLASDLDANGGKLILTAGAPKVTGDDEERMLLALRRIVESDPPLPLRIGVNRGATFAGDIGPFYRRTYTVMGDTVNLAARLMAKAEPGQIYATAGVLDHSSTLFDLTELEPFPVKGKAEPIHAWAVGPAKGSRARQVELKPLPLTGRDAELAILREVLERARAGSGRLVEISGEMGIGKTRLLEALREEASGFRLEHALCQAYTASTPYAVWSELLREMLGMGRDEREDVVEARMREAVATTAPDLAPWLPLIAIAFGIAIESTPEVDMLAEENRRARLHEVVQRFLEATLTQPTFVEIDIANHMDEASADLLAHLARSIGEHPWVIGVARRPGDGGFKAPDAEAVVRIPLEPISEADALKLSQLATEERPLHMHVLEVVAKRSGGNPQFLRDLLRVAIETGGTAGLPDSAEAAAMARIDALPPEDRALVRRAAVFGLTFHPRMLGWLAGDGEDTTASPSAWARLREMFEDDGDGYLRFRRSLLRDAAYEGLPFRVRRQFHGRVAAHIEEEADNAEDQATLLSLHYAAAGDYPPAWRYGKLAAKRAEGAYAFVEAANLYARSLEAGRQLPEISDVEIGKVQESLADAWYGAGEYRKALEIYTATKDLFAGNRLLESEIVLKVSRTDHKLGDYPEALRAVEQVCASLEGERGLEAARQAAKADSWRATVLHNLGRTAESLDWAERAVREAEEVEEWESLGDAYLIIGFNYGLSGKEGGEPVLLKALEAFKRSGDRVSQATILSNLGVVCQWEGRWDDAMAYYERGREEMERLGNVLNAGIARMNVAEILIDRGEFADAEAMLQQTIPLWRSSESKYLLGMCFLLLGRASVRAGRVDEAQSRLNQARALLAEVGADMEVADVDARLAETRLLASDPQGALGLADEVLGRADAAEAVARLTPLLHRVRGYAMLLLADPLRAREAFRASLASARERKDLFESALTLNALCNLEQLEGVEPPQDLVEESRAVVAKLAIRTLPVAPTPA